MTILIGALAALVFLALVVGLRGAHWGDWWYWYDRYLASRRWKMLRDQVTARDDETCQECGTCHYPILQAHHLPGAYKPWWWYALRLPERKKNLVTLCRRCHRRAHKEE